MRYKGVLTTLVCFFAFSIAIHAQTDTKCDALDKDCQAAEKKSTDADKADARSVDTDIKFKSAKFVPDNGHFGVKPSKADLAYKPKSPAVNSSDPQQQTPEEEAQALAKKLSNPVASLISLPFQNNFDFGMGPNGDGFKYTLNIQPVIPVKINKDWNLISRTIVPITYQSKVVGTTSQFGLSDTVQTFFFSPNKSTPVILGFGPQFLIPTATNEYLGTQKFGLGPSLLVMKQQGQWSVGILATQMWSVAGKSTRADVSSTFLQPFISYTTKTAWTYNINTEATYDWTADRWSVPIHFTVTKLVKIGSQRVSVGGALRCWTATTPSGPEGCGFRLLFTPLFPKK